MEELDALESDIVDAALDAWERDSAGMWDLIRSRAREQTVPSGTGYFQVPCTGAFGCLTG